MAGNCNTCGHDPNAPRGHARTPSGMCHEMEGRLECKCLRWTPIAVPVGAGEVV